MCDRHTKTLRSRPSWQQSGATWSMHTRPTRSWSHVRLTEKS